MLPAIVGNPGYPGTGNDFPANKLPGYPGYAYPGTRVPFSLSLILILIENSCCRPEQVSAYPGRNSYPVPGYPGSLTRVPGYPCFFEYGHVPGYPLEFPISGTSQPTSRNVSISHGVYT
eukprot:2593002-Rhodomonas_salina.1